MPAANPILQDKGGFSPPHSVRQRKNAGHGPKTPNRREHKSLLVLFFRKELLTLNVPV
jgi:hypothetical protein